MASPPSSLPPSPGLHPARSGQRNPNLAAWPRSSRSPGARSGEGRILTPDQEAHLQKLIVEKRREQLKMEFALRTRAAAGQLIAVEFKIKL